MSEFKWNDKMEALAQKHFTPEQLQELRSRPFDAADQARVSAAWTQIFAEIAELPTDADPTSSQALDIAARAQILIDEFTRGDPGLIRAAAAMNSEALADRELASRMPGEACHWQFLARAMRALPHNST